MCQNYQAYILRPVRLFPECKHQHMRVFVVHTLEFMKEVILSNRDTGAFAPSSKALADVITDMARLQGAKVVLEYGPGTGVFTETLLHKLDKDAYFAAFEVNETFVKVLKERFPNANIYQDGAQNAIKYMREAGHEHCDAIVSGLPWTRFPESLQDEILEATWNVLKPGGRFVTFAYSFSPLFPSGRRFLHGKLPEKFGKVEKSKAIWKNFPPCNVYIAEKPL